MKALNCEKLTVIQWARGDKKEFFRRIAYQGGKVISNDRLLNCLAVYITSEAVEWKDILELAPEYEKLSQVFACANKEEILLDYLESWYQSHSEYAWYGSHLRDADTYCGYWSFESAAIVKMLSLDERRVKANEFYPCI